jgi:3',5'-cyclic AMP phosphodiesterase CpdA
MSQLKKLIVVTGATGSQVCYRVLIFTVELANKILQGFPIIKYLLGTNRYNVRAVTRQIDSPRATLLKDVGAEVVLGDYDNPATLTDAFSGADAVFCNTNFWEHLSVDNEIRQGLAVAKAAAEEPRVKNFIYSYLADSRTLLGGKYQDNQAYNAKSLTLESIQTQFPELYKITTKLSIAFYYDNWVKYQLAFGPIKQKDGVFEMAMPYPSTNKIPTASPEDAGVVIATIIDTEGKYNGKWISLVAEQLTDDEKLATWVEGKCSVSQSHVKELTGYD